MFCNAGAICALINGSFSDRDMEIMGEDGHKCIFLVSTAFMPTHLPFDPLPIPPRTLNGSPSGVQDFHKTMPFILMSVMRSTDKVTNLFSSTC